MSEFDDLIPERKPRNPGKRERATEFDDLVPVYTPKDNPAALGDYQPLPDLMPEYDDNGNVLRATPFAPLGAAKPGFVDTIVNAFKRGSASTVATGLHTASDFIDQTVQAPLRGILGQLGMGEAFADPLGAKSVADDSLGVEREINADRLKVQQSIGGRPTLGDLRESPLDASKQYGLHLANIGAESLPAFIGAVALRNPQLAAGALGGTSGAQTYTDMRADGTDRIDAAQAGLLSAALESGGEALSLPLVMGKGGKSSLLRAMVAEGAQEAPVALGQQYVQDSVTGNETPIGQQLGDALDAALVGAGLGAAGHGLSVGTEKLTTPQAPNAAPRETPQAVNITGGVPATPADIANDAAVVEQFNARKALGAPPADDIDALLARNLPPEDAAPDLAAVVDALPPELVQSVLGAIPNSAAPSDAPPPSAPPAVPQNPTLKQAPIVRYRAEAANLETAAPPVAEGTTRLWRGNRPGEVGKASTFTNDLPGIALPFRDAYGGDLSYVDVPTESLPDYENKAGAAPGAEFNVPAEIAQSARTLGASIEQANPLEAGRLAGAVLPDADVAADPAPAVPGDVAGTQAQGVNPNYGDRPGDSWVLRNKETGEVIAETYDRKKVDALNTAKYEAVPVREHLQEVNTEGTKAYARARGLEMPAMQASPAETRATPSSPDDVIQTVAPDGYPAPPPARFSAADMRSLVGWSQRGGEMVRAPVDPEQLNEEQRNGLVPSPKGEVIGRTRWTGYPGPDGQESTFWKNRPVPYTPAQATAVFDKFEAGETLTKREQRFIDYAQETAAAYDDALNLQADEARGYEQIAAQQDMAELRAQLESDIADADAAEAMSLADLYRELAQSGVDLGTVTPSDTEADGEYAARLWQRLNETRNGTDQPAKAGDSAQGPSGRGSRQSGAGVEPSFQLAPARTDPTAAAGQADGNVPRDAGVRDAYDGRQADRVIAEPAPAVVEEAPAPRVTGTKNAVTDAERTAAGRDPILREAVQSNEETVVRAMRELREEPTAGDEAVARLSRDGVESISVADEAILLVHKTDLLNKREAAAKKLADQNASESTKDAAREAWAEAEAKIAQLDIAASNAGREWGRFGQFRQRMMREDFTLAAMERKERARLERPLTSEESATIKAMADTIAVLQGKVDALQERMNNAASESAYEALARSIARPPRKRPTLEALRTAANDARARLSSTQGVPSRRGQSGAILSPAVFYDYAVIGAFHIADGAAKFSDWVSAMSADLGDAFDRIKADHPNIFKAAQQEVEKEGPADPAAPTVATVLETLDPDDLTSRDVKRLVEAHIRAGVRGETPVMAAVHKSLSDTFDGITEREVRRLFADYGNASFPSQEEAKVELRQLRSLVQMQESIDRISEGLAPLRSGPQRDAMTQQVREKRVRLNELLKTLAKDAKSPTQMRSYNDMRVRNLTNQIEDLEKQIRTGDRPTAKAKTTPTAEIQALVDRRDALVRERDSVDVGAKKNEAEKRALRKRIEAVEAKLRGEAPAPKDPLQRVEDREATDLRKRLDALRERRDQVGREAAAREGLGEQIADLMQRLAGKAKPAAPVKAQSSAVVTELRRIRDELAGQLRELERAATDPEARYQEMRGKQIAKRIQELQGRIAAGDFAARPRIPRALDEANQRAKFELDKAKEAFLRHQFEDSLRKRTPLGKAFGLVGDTFNLARAMMTSFDLSAILRQGGFITYGHPKRALSSVGPSLRAFASAQAEFNVKNEIQSRANAPLYAKYGLQLTGIGSGPLTQIEEAYASRWLDRFPTWLGGGLVRGSGRSYTAFLNKLRADSFDAMAASLGKRATLTEAEGKAIANYINVATGRGKIGTNENAGQVLNTVFFAPRLVASRFQLLAGQPLYGGTPRTKKLIAQEYARFLIGVSIVTALAAFGFGEEEDDSDKPLVRFDPRSADFGKVRIGNTYLDPLAGLAQVTVLLARLATGETVGSGDAKPLRPSYTLTDLRRALGEDIPAHEMAKDGKLPFGGSSADGTIGRFLRTKLAPVPGAIINTLAGSNLIGEEVTPAKAAADMVVPMSFQSITDVMEEHGIPKGTAITAVGLLGMGVQHRAQTNAQAFADFTGGLNEVRTEVKERLKAVPVEQWPATMAALRKEYGPAMEGLELQVYKSDGKYGEEGEPRRDADGNPVLKSNRIADNYREDSGAMDDEQVHHAIPDNLARHHPLMARARSLGYDLDHAGNLLNMPKKSDGYRIAHRTNHPDYDAEVFALLQEAEKRLKKAHGSLKEAPKPAVLDEVRKIESEMRERIHRKDVPTKNGRLAMIADDEDAEAA